MKSGNPRPSPPPPLETPDGKTVFLGVAIPLLFPFPLPIRVSDDVRAVYDKIEEVAGEEEAIMPTTFTPRSKQCRRIDRAIGCSSGIELGP